ncbi:MAG: RidA family protein [Thermodesulfovibrionales bacterium]|nr:RidA family protein [Thermodesulfovibrionales bacterium]
MSSIENRLKELGIELDNAFTPIGLYAPCLEVDKLIYVSAILPIKNGVLIHKGKVGREVTISQTEDCIKQIITNTFTLLKNHLHSLDNLKRCLKMTGYIASLDEFYDHPKIMNYASNLLLNIFGEEGNHVRTVIGVCSLPLNAPIMIDFIFEQAIKSPDNSVANTKIKYE